MLTLSEREQIVEQLLSRWEDQHERGQDLSARQLCKSHPELISDVAAGIEALRFFEITASSRSRKSRTGKDRSLRANVTATLGRRFNVESMVGYGAFGVVYRALDLKLGRNVAVKWLLRDSLIDRFRKEAKILALVHSPHVVTIYDSRETPNGGMVLIMQFVEGGNLRNAMNASNGRIEERRSLSWMTNVATGMLAAAKEGVIHRDLKPANILIDKESLAVVADFGLAIGTSTSLATSFAGAVGTPWYMSPEQFTNSHKVDTRSDVYSFGATFYHVLVGEAPFHADSFFELGEKHRREPLVPPIQRNPKLSEGTSRLLTKCLAKSPGQRFQAFDEVIRELGKIDNSSHPIRRDKPPPEDSRRSRKEENTENGEAGRSDAHILVPLWVYKCNTSADAEGNWNYFFDQMGGYGGWGGTWCIKNHASRKIVRERLQVGDLVLAWQSNKQAAYGLCRVGDLEDDGEDITIVLETLLQFPKPVNLLEWKKRSPGLKDGKAFQKGNAGTIFGTTDAEAAEILQICGVDRSEIA